MPQPLPEDVLAELRTALFRGQKIRAIKLCRAATGLGLKEAKEMMEALEGELRAQEPESFLAGPAPASRSWLGLLLLIAMLVVFGGVVWGVLHHR